MTRGFATASTTRATCAKCSCRSYLAMILPGRSFAKRPFGIGRCLALLCSDFYAYGSYGPGGPLCYLIVL